METADTLATLHFAGHQKLLRANALNNACGTPTERNATCTHTVMGHEIIELFLH